MLWFFKKIIFKTILTSQKFDYYFFKSGVLFIYLFKGVV